MNICRITAIALTLLTSGLVSAQTNVQVAPLSEIATYPQRFAPATVISLNQPFLSAQISANVAEFPARVGDTVAKGEVLARLDCSDYLLSEEAASAGQASAEAQLELAKSQLERAQSLVENNLVSVQEIDSRRTAFDSALATVRSATASHQLASLNVSRCEIRAPFDALVLDRLAGVGQLVVLGTPMLQVLDLESIEISAQVFASDAQLLEMANFIEFSSDGTRFAVQLDTVVAAVNSQNRSREARLSFVEEQALPGSAGQIYWRDSRPHLPAQYLLERNGQLGFFIDNASVAEFVPVANAQSGRSNPVEVSMDTLVIVESFAGLSDGDRLTVSESE